MSEVEILTTQIGEFVSVEMDDVERVDYTSESGGLTAFTIVMKNGRRYVLAIKETT